MSFGLNSFFGSGVGAAAQPPPNSAMDTEVPNAPSDTVSCLRFSPLGCPNTFLLAASWDKTVRLWQITPEGGINLCITNTTEAPLLDSCWNHDGSQAYVCGVDKCAYRWDFPTNTMIQIAVHDAPIRTIHYIQSSSYICIMTGGWDNKLKFWDLQNNAILQVIDLNDRVYCSDVHFPMAVVATADRKIHIYDLTNGVVEVQCLDSQLKYQSRCISIFLDKTTKSPAGFALGSIEGRVSIQSLDFQNIKATFTFKCHRSVVDYKNTQDIYAVNGVSFNPIHQSLATVGSDGKYAFWDINSRTKIKGSQTTEQQMITACDISANGNIFAYAFGYDWSKGYENNDPTKKPQIFIKQCFEEMKTQVKK